MGILYSSIVAVILLFPWSVVALMVAGGLWERLKLRATGGKTWDS